MQLVCASPSGHCLEDGNTPTPEPVPPYESNSSCKGWNFTQSDPYIGFVSGGPSGQYLAGFGDTIDFSISFLPGCVALDMWASSAKKGSVLDTIGDVLSGLNDSGACSGLPEPRLAGACSQIAMTLELITNTWSFNQEQLHKMLDDALDYDQHGISSGVAFIKQTPALDPFLDGRERVVSQHRLVYGSDASDLNPCFFGIFGSNSDGHVLMDGHDCAQYWAFLYD
jgi:hypothetical protein